MNLASYIVELQERGKLYFSIDDVCKVFNKPKSNMLSSIHHFKRKGILVSPIRGFYIIIPINERKRGSLQPQDMVVITMKYLDIPYYAGLLSAAAYHGASHQAPQVFQVITNKRIRKPWIFGSVGIEFIYKKNVKDTKIENRIVNAGYLNISTPEETAKDIMIYYEKSGGLNHQATVLSELIEAIDVSELLIVVRKSTNKAWIQRMGYILSKLEPLDINKRDKILDCLYKYLRNKKLNYTALAPEISTEGYPKCKKWKIIENTEIESDI